MEYQRAAAETSDLIDIKIKLIKLIKLRNFTKFRTK